MEVSDTLLGYTKLIHKLADINMIRSRKVRNFQEISGLPEDSKDVFHASWTDTYYPNRPTDLEDTNLYDFLACYDLVSNEPKQSETYFPFLTVFLS